MNKGKLGYFLIGMELLLVGFFFLYQYKNTNSNMKEKIIKNDNISKSSVLVANLFKENKTLNNNQLERQEEIEIPEKDTKELENIEKVQVEEKKTQNMEENVEKINTLSNVDTSKYIINTLKGFNITTNNKIYTLSDDEFNVVAGVIGCEAVNLNDALAVASVILNRADRRGSTPLQIVSAAGQFSCYHKQNIKSYAVEALADAVAGVRNNGYDSFNGWYSSVSDNYIVEGGNRFY